MGGVSYDDRFFLHPERPLVGVDVDGVINAVGPVDEESYVVQTVLGYRIRTHRDLPRILQPLLDATAAGRCDLFWASMWEAAAGGALSPVIAGIGADWPHLMFTRPTESSSLEERREFQERMRQFASEGVYFKSPYIGDLAAGSGRPIIWIDDECSQSDEQYFAARDDIAAPVRCVTTDSATGIRSENVAAILDLLNQM